MKILFVSSMMSAAAHNFVPPSTLEVNDSKVEKVTVFLAGAQVSRSGFFNLQPGVSEVTFTGLSAFIDANSLQAKGIGDFTIMDVKYDVYYPQPDPIKTDPLKIPNDILKKMTLIEDSLETLNFQMEELRAKKEVREMERTMLLNNGTVKGVGKVNDSIQLLKTAMEYFHQKMTEINLDLFQMKKKQDAMNKHYNEIQNRLTALQNWSSNNNLIPVVVKGPDYRIVVTVNSEKLSKGKLEVTYLVNQAGWTPSYDIRTKDINSPIELNYKANVYQNTGEEWEKVSLTLSSNNPYTNQQKPELSPWYITSYYVQDPYSYQKSKGYYDDLYKHRDAERASASGAVANMQDNLAEAPATSSLDFTVKTENMISAEFEIKLPYTIKSNNKPHLVSVSKEALNAKYFLAMVPKLDKNAFLIANVTNWDDLNLLPALANIYYDGTYVGQSYIDPSAMEDTLKLALGRDNSITAIRKKQKEKEKEKIIGDNKLKEVTYEINIRNAHSYPVDLIIEDQTPVSSLADVKVDVTDKGHGELNPDNGFLKWKMKLKGAGSEKIRFTYSVKYDKNKTLSMAW